jgi:hypothetical protein
MISPGSIAQISCALLIVILGQAIVLAQTGSSFRVSKILPYDKAVPGQIMELQVEGLGGGPPVKLLPPEDFRVEVTQDGVKQQVRPRLVLPTMSRTRNSDGTMGEMTPFQNVSFVVPHGLHPGDVQVALLYESRQSNVMTLTIVDRPLRPVIAGPAVMTMSPSSLIPPPPGTRISDMGWRFERDSKIQLHLKPLADPDDPGAAILIHFKQGDAVYDATARVLHQSQRVERTGKSVAFLPPRDFLEVEIPPGLTMGPADMEIRLRANGAESDPMTIKVQIADSTRSAEAPVVNAPRILSATPRKVGAGQALMLSVDYLRTLAPDPSQTMVLIEHDAARYIVKPETNTALRSPNKSPDAPVVLIIRPTREIIGPAQVHVFNSLKGEQGGESPGVPIEVVDEALPPEIISVAESTDADLAHLREMYETERRAGRPFKPYDPQSRYLTIHGRGIDPNPSFVRIVLEQNGQSVTLSRSDFSYASVELLIVRLPRTATSGPASMSIVNVGAESVSVPVTKTFELSGSR